MKKVRIPALLLAAVLQVLPMCRTVCTSPAFTSTLAIVFRWTLGATAAFGAFDSVSGGSQVYFDCPGTAVGTVGMPFTFYMTLGGTIGTDPGSIIAAAPLPAGFTNYSVSHFTSPVSEWGVISGTPTSTMTNVLINLAASHPSFQNGVPVTGSLYLTVYPTSDPVVITSNPTNVIATNSQTVSFSVAATGSGPFSYQWFKGNTNIYNHIQSATNATYSFRASTNTSSGSFAVNAGNYLVRVAGAAGMVSSSIATLTVSNPAVAPSISVQPTNRTVTAGLPTTFFVVASGTAPLSYQWRLGGTALASATNSALNIASVQSTNAGGYTVVVTNVAGSITSAVATLTVIVPPGITDQPQDQTVIAGQPANFSVTAAGTAALSYQWRLNEVAVSGETNSALNISNAQPTNAGTYTVVVTNVAGSTTSAVATLTVNVPPGITDQPQGQTVVAGQPVNFSVTAAGTAPLSYQWRLNEVAVSGETNSTLNISNAQPTNAGPYTVVVTNVAGSITSAVVTLTVNVPPGITDQPQDQTVVAGQPANFSVTATGTEPLTYQWLKDGTNFSDFATNSSWSLANARLADAGSYSVVVTNAAGSKTSSNAQLTVTIPPAPVLSSAARTGNAFLFTFTPVTGLTNSVLTSDSVRGSGWSVFTNIPPPSTAASITITDEISGNLKFYRVSFTP